MVAFAYRNMSVYVISVQIRDKSLSKYRKKSQLSVSQSRKQNSPVKNDGFEKSEGQKIGEIKTAEGSVIVFYKTSDGKIKKMKEESKK